MTLNNNIIHARQSAILQYIRSGWIVNNIIIGAVGSNVNSAVLRFVYDSIIENNIIYNTTGSFRVFNSLDNNTLRNNVVSLSSLSLSGNTLENNYLSVDIPEIFINYPGDDFSFEGDYNLVDPDAYQGTTGNQVGIYGGISPKKANTRPSNPQILSVEIGHGTDDEGMLHVELQVEAQEQ